MSNGQNEPLNAGEAVPEQEGDVLRRILQKMAEDLRPHEAEVPPSWRACTEPGRLYLGECFARALDFIGRLNRSLEHGDPAKDQLWLVHGQYCFAAHHGWCQLPGDVVFDGNFQQFYSRAGYYARVYPSPWYKYTAEAAFFVERHMLRTPEGTISLGLWHEHLRLPWADPDNPTVIDGDRAWVLVQAAGLHARAMLARLGASQHGIWRSAAEVAAHVARRREIDSYVPEADRRTAEGRTRGIEAVLEANLPETLVAEYRREYVTLRLLSNRKDLGISSGQKCPVLQGLDEFAQLRLGGRVWLNCGVEGGSLQYPDHMPQ